MGKQQRISNRIHAVGPILVLFLLVFCGPWSLRSATAFGLQQTYLGEVLHDQFGFSVSCVGDVNADGFDDFLVGANVNDEAAPSGGKAYLYLGGPAYPSMPSVTYAGSVEKENVGGAVAGGVDLNQDGFEDWVLGAPGLGTSGSAAGRVYVFLGGSPPDASADLILEGDQAGGQFGAALCLVPDLDGDGSPEIVVAAPRAGSGRVYIYRSGPLLDDVPDRILNARASDDRFGRSLGWLPDRNADGRDDLVVGVPRSSEAATWAGVVLIYEGTADLDTLPDLVLLGEAAGDEFGSSLACGADVDGDTAPDLIVGAPAANVSSMLDVGKAYLFRGGFALDDTVDLIFSGATSNDRFASAVASDFDWDGDGERDLAIGAPDFGVTDAGAVLVYRGGALLDAVADSTILGTADGAHLGSSLAPAGDVRRNLRGGLLVGGYNAMDSGRVLLFGSDATAVDVASPPLLSKARLLPARPNPFNPHVETVLQLAHAGTWVVRVYDARGQRVTTLHSGWLGEGEHRLRWNGRNSRGESVASAIYWIHALGPDTRTQVSAVLVR